MDIALTFDNGPDLLETSKMLDVVARPDITATFFLACDKLRQSTMRGRGRTHQGRRTPPRQAHAASWASPGHDAGGRCRRARDRRDAGDPGRPRGSWQAVPSEREGRIGPHLLDHHAVRHLSAERFTCVLWSVMPLGRTDPRCRVDRALAACSTQARSTIAVHDRAGGGMPHLYRFIREVKARDGRFQRSSDEDVVVISEGLPNVPLTTIVNTDPGPDVRLPPCPLI